MRAIINADIFLMKTKGCEVEVIHDLESTRHVTGKIVTQPNKHSKAPRIGTKIQLNVLELDYL